MGSRGGPEKMEVEGGVPPVQSADHGRAVARPKFEPLTAHEMSGGKVQFRKVSVPPHRFSPLKKAWMEIYTPIYEQMKVDVRMNLKVVQFCLLDMFYFLSLFAV